MVDAIAALLPMIHPLSCGGCVAADDTAAVYWLYCGCIDCCGRYSRCVLAVLAAGDTPAVYWLYCGIIADIDTGAVYRL